MTALFLEDQNIFILCSFILSIISFAYLYVLSFTLGAVNQPFFETSYFLKTLFVVNAIMFLLFDIEVLYLFPLVSSLYGLVTLDVFIILGFYLLLFSSVGLLYGISRKVLDFQLSRYRIYFFFKLVLNSQLFKFFIKSLMALIMFIILMPVMLVEGGNVPNQTSNEVFSDLINTFSQEEIDNFNLRVQEIIRKDLLVQHNAIIDFYRRIALAIIINASIYVIIRYSSDIINSVWDFFRSLPDAATNVVQFLFSTARDVALQNYQRATPEQQNAMLALARNIEQMRNGVPPAV
jgi:hypothetical protein